MNRAHHQAVAALDEFTDALETRGVDLHDVSSGWRITPSGTVLVQLRPFHPTELLLLAEALLTPSDPA